MSEEQTVTLRYETGGGELVEIDVPAHVAEALDRGQGVVEYGDWPQRRFKGQEAEDRIQAWLEEIRRGS